MKEFYETKKGLMICLHGGAGPMDPSKEGIKKSVRSLDEISKSGMDLLKAGESAQNVAIHCLKLLEDDPLFNAGLGSALQADGLARLSASFMESVKQRFSGIISTPYIQNPSLLAKELQNRQSRVLTLPGSELLARELALPIAANLTEKRCKKWIDNLEKQAFNPFLCDTVGVAVRDEKNQLAGASSTGGRGFEFPGRVSDTPTVAGNYCTRFAAICATGFGEEIVDDALCARIETRVRDGMSLKEACQKTFIEASDFKRRYGWIALDRNSFAVCHLTPCMSFAVRDETKIILAADQVQ